MGHLSQLCLILWMLALAVCGGACEQPTPRPVCPGTVRWRVEAWVDWNGNGTRDPEDGPLEGVAFRMEWYYYGDGSGERIKTWTSDASGYAEADAEGCGGPYAKIHAEAPPGYTLTTHDRQSFGFSPP
jgi:hypothetical protein